MAASTIASFLSSPTIRLVLPPAEPGSTEGDKTYIVHRSLLAAHTSLLKSRRTRDSYVVLDSSTVDTPAVERTLEFFYTGDYTVPAKEGPKEEEDDEPLIHSARPAAHLPKDSPIVAAAMAGRIGVWGKSAPRFDEAENTSSYTSIYFPKEDKPTKEQVVTHDMANGFGKNKTNGFLPSPPASPVFQSYTPKLSLKAAPKPTEPPPPVVPHHLLVLRAHISLYRFANIPTVNIPGLSTLALSKLTSLFGSTTPSDLPSLVIDFVDSVFKPCLNEEELRAFLVGRVVTRIGELNRSIEFNDFIRKGGEFVVDVLGSLAVAGTTKS